MNGPERLAAFMEKRGKTQDWLAEQLGVTASYVSLLLAGKRTPSLDIATKIERITGIAPRHFVGAA